MLYLEYGFVCQEKQAPSAACITYCYANKTIGIKVSLNVGALYTRI